MRGRFWAAQLARLPGSVPSRLCAFHIKCSLLGMHAAAARCKTQLKRVKIATPGIAVERIAVPHAASWLFLGSSSVPSTRAVGRAGYGDSFRADFTEVSEGSNPSLPKRFAFRGDAEHTRSLCEQYRTCKPPMERSQTRSIYGTPPQQMRASQHSTSNYFAERTQLVRFASNCQRRIQRRVRSSQLH